MRISPGWLTGALMISIACALSPVEAQPAPPDSSAGDADRAAEFLRKGNDLYNQDKYAEAEVQYRLAWDIKKAHDVATNLGHAEFQLGKFRDAAEHYDYALRTFPVIGVPAKRKILTDRFEEAKKHVGALHIVVSRPGAEIRVDGNLVGTAPLDHDIFVDEGPHQLQAKLGESVQSLGVTSESGSSQNVTLTIVDAPASTPSATASAIPTPTASARAVPIASAIPSAPRPVDQGSIAGPWLIGGGIAAGAVGLGLGIVGAAVRRTKSSDADGMLADLTARHASCPADPICSQLKSVRSSHDSFANLETAGFAIGGAGVAALIAGFLITRSSAKAESPGAMQVTPAVGADRGGLGLRGSF